MPGWSMINGVWREMLRPTPNINNVVRNSDVFANINGVTRVIYARAIDPSEVVGFRMVYKRSTTRKHPSFPELSYNPNLPVTVFLTGDTKGTMDGNEKGIILEYSNERPDEEGILMYEGRLYMVLLNGDIIDVTRSCDDVGWEETGDPGNQGIEHAHATSKIMDLSIYINYTSRYEAFGYNMFGWNSFFSTEDFLDYTRYPDKGPNKNITVQNSYNILPVYRRWSTFDAVAKIGIARDMTDPDKNMIGSYGVLDQSIHHIFLEGEPKPFVVELYD